MRQAKRTKRRKQPSSDRLLFPRESVVSIAPNPSKSDGSSTLDGHADSDVADRVAESVESASYQISGPPVSGGSSLSSSRQLRREPVNPCAGGGFGENPFDPYSGESKHRTDTTRPNELIGGKNRRELQQQVQGLCPPVPGVYGMFDKTGELIYVGKSRSLRHRLMSYFGDAARKEKAGRIIEHSRAIQWETQPSDFAAQLRELDLIRQWTPRFNVQGVPQRQRPVYLVLGRKPAETFYIASSPPTTDCVAVEGPFYGVSRMGRVVDSLNKTFGLRDCSQKTVFQFAEQMSLFDLQPRPGCLRLEIGTCLGPCAAACTRAEYLERVNAAQSFIDGFNDEPIVATQEIMENASQNQQYELAARARDSLGSLNYALKKLSHLANARESYSFVYAATGYDGRSIWYLIRRGEVVDVAPAPRDAIAYGELKPLLKLWTGRLGPRKTTFASEHPYTVSVVASWFRKHKKELKQTFAPKSAGRRYRHLARVGV